MATREMRMMNITDDEKSSIPPPGLLLERR